MFKQRVPALLIALSLLAIQLACDKTIDSTSNSNGAGGTVYRAGGPETKPVERRQPSRASQFKPSRLNIFEIKDDIELGKESAEKIMGQVTLVGDEEIVNYVRKLGKSLTAAAPYHEYPYEFHVIASKEINAFALPGGTIFVNAGAIMAAKNEAELAGVISHEVAHVALRHGTEQATKAVGAQAVKDIIDRVTGGDSTQVGRAINAIGGLGANVVFLKFGRDAEREADLEGARIMSELEYDPNDMANFFRTLEEGSKEQGPEFLSDHPNPGNRIAAIKETIGTLRVNPNPIRSTEEFERAKAKLKSGAVPLNSRGPSRTGPEK
jgi:beta-barrel assembly-enhancing protease